MKFYRLAFFSVLLFSSFYQKAQKDSSLSFSQKKWEKLSQGVDYTETYKEAEEEKKSKSSITTHCSSQYFSDLKYILYFFVLVLILFLIYRIVNNFKSNAGVKGKTISLDTIEEIEENMHEIDLEELLKEAVLAKNYRIALRVNFLIIIKLLSQKGAIIWAKEKTNWEYYSELQDKLLADQLKGIIESFEAVWYGEHALTELHYHQVEPAYAALQKRLKPHE